MKDNIKEKFTPFVTAVIKEDLDAMKREISKSDYVSLLYLIEKLDTINRVVTNSKINYLKMLGLSL